MIVLTYGQKIPETGDRGTPLFQALEDNFTRMDGHTHDGIDSPLLSHTAFTGIVDTISAAGWASVPGMTGHYRQAVTMHTGFSFDTTKITFRTSTGTYIYPTVERISATQYYVYTIDNTIDYKAVYGG